ncbi:MAG: hypothetical protein CVV64_16710 [Candidatus Wallbacteria bacterium HGW-Wallbacteria-1]|jgi:hypothetical protein|uniref:DUF2207 domain-containing protein n=1 Tax=Candidatus Wallbacteria bacterium HGW-Wallbacteria-1 TaxID=2013854 RepID=A0A2N1PKM9_9BACT|nr:MAG: hypothetical protein CVV64_16710 [Candidatus Wallbacteria bacterium HGW-Wallbacteria-1]
MKLKSVQRFCSLSPFRISLLSWAFFLLPIILVLLSPFSGLFPALVFHHERIEVTIEGDIINVEGHYFYRNTWPFRVSQTLSVPLPHGSDEKSPIEPEVIMVSPESRNIDVRNILGREIFSIMVESGKEAEVVVRYSQAATQRRGRYLLTTTKPWGKPLVRGEYTLEFIGAEMVSIESNYPLEKLGNGLWCFRKKDFMPVMDWEFSW